MASTITSVTRADLSGNMPRGNREDAPTSKKRQQNQSPDNNTINTLFSDAMRAVLEEQARIDPVTLQNNTKVFFAQVADRYDDSVKYKQSPLLKDYHVKNFVV